MAEAASADIHSTITDAQGHPHTANPTGCYLAVLSLTALGIVYGDIGTSPLYAMRECFHGPHAIRPTPENVFVVMSLIFWALTIAEKQLGPEHRHVALILESYAELLRKMNRIAEAQEWSRLRRNINFADRAAQLFYRVANGRLVLGAR
jgi:hypothetical protein